MATIFPSAMATSAEYMSVGVTMAPFLMSKSSGRCNAVYSLTSTFNVLACECPFIGEISPPVCAPGTSRSIRRTRDPRGRGAESEHREPWSARRLLLAERYPWPHYPGRVVRNREVEHEGERGEHRDCHGTLQEQDSCHRRSERGKCSAGQGGEPSSGG